MTTSTLSPKNQTTLNVNFIRQLKLRAGTKFKQTLEGGRIILQPLSGADSAFGSLRPGRKFISTAAETKGMERAVGRKIGSRSAS